jgi:hypothetical protein
MAERNGKEDGRTAALVYPPVTEEDKPVYANYVAVSHTPWDFAVHFGTVVMPAAPVASGQKSGTVEIPVRKVQTVNLPIPLIKGFIKALQTQVEKYEQSYGEIKNPTKVTK